MDDQFITNWDKMVQTLPSVTKPETMPNMTGLIIDSFIIAGFIILPIVIYNHFIIPKR